MVVRIWPDNPNPKQIHHAAEVLRADGVVVYPTDGVYALGCSLRNPKAIARLTNLREATGPPKHNAAAIFTLVFDHLARVAEYARVDTPQFRVLKRNTPGAFTFLVAPLSRVPDKALAGRRSIGVRIPDNAIARALVEELGCPLLSTSLHGGFGEGLGTGPDSDEADYLVDPSLIAERFGRLVDMVIDGGTGGVTPSTIVDLLTDAEPVILRQGGGVLA